MSNPSAPVVCVSYLAHAELWTVPQFPCANHGAEIRSIEWSVAADAPMAAAALVSMGAPVLLIANDIGTDEQGVFVDHWLRQRDVRAAPVARSKVITPRIVVAADDAHTRTWFAHLPEVATSLNQADLSPVVGASKTSRSSSPVVSSSGSGGSSGGGSADNGPVATTSG